MTERFESFLRAPRHSGRPVMNGPRIREFLVPWRCYHCGRRGEAYLRKASAAGAARVHAKLHKCSDPDGITGRLAYLSRSRPKRSRFSELEAMVKARDGSTPRTVCMFGARYVLLKTWKYFCVGPLRGDETEVRTSSKGMK